MLDAAAGRGKPVLAFAGHHQGPTMQALPGQMNLQRAGLPGRAHRGVGRPGS